MPRVAQSEMKARPCELNMFPREQNFVNRKKDFTNLFHKRTEAIDEHKHTETLHHYYSTSAVRDK